VVGPLETVRQHKDGRLLTVSLTVSPIRSEEGAIVGASKIVRDVTELRRAEREQVLLASIVASSDDAIPSKDAEGVVSSWNTAAERMFGYTAEEAIGRPIKQLIIPADRQGEEDEVLRRIRAGDKVDHFETVRCRKDGTFLDVSITVSPIRNRKGQVVGASKVARDISERKQLLAQVEQASRMKDEFLATLSHELRTPLNAIMGYAQILVERADNEAMRRAADIIQRNGRTLTQIVSDILDMSAVAAGKTRLQIEAYDLVAVLDEALAVIRPAADAKGVTLTREVPETISMIGDPRRIQQVLWNLFANAVKFTPANGTVAVTVALRAGDVAVTVSDTGIGMEAEFLPRVFHRFSQADSRSTREFGGIGIGLALVRHFVELHGGQVRAWSAGPGQGSTFEVVLPHDRRH
jgi:PAS domain S-box-containing protein